MFRFMVPTDRELFAAHDWWDELPNSLKGQCSIWVILAMYAEEVLHRDRRRSDLEEHIEEAKTMRH